MVAAIPAIVSAIPSIIKLFDSDERDDGVKELTGQVITEASKVLGVDFKTKDDIVDHLNAHPEKVIELQEIEFKTKQLVFQDRKDARQAAIARQNSSASGFVKSTPALLAIITVLGAGLLDVYILYEGFAKGLEALNPVITLIAGNVSARAGQVLGFYFGGMDDKGK